MRVAFRRREIIEPHLGDIDDDAFVRRLRQQMLGRHLDVPADARHPRVDHRIGGDDRDIADIVLARDIEQGILGRRAMNCRLADQRRAGAGA